MCCVKDPRACPPPSTDTLRKILKHEEHRFQFTFLKLTLSPAKESLGHYKYTPFRKPGSKNEKRGSSGIHTRKQGQLHQLRKDLPISLLMAAAARPEFNTQA